MIPKPTNARFDVAIVGLGYVGIPLALGFASSGCRTLGYDADCRRVVELQERQSPFEHIPSEDLAACLDSGLLEICCATNRLAETQAIIVCVPTPLHRHQDPDLSHVLGVARDIAPYLRYG
ncbi:MAG TPA: UDP-N-acetyl-D-glucosamine dehydrogenase, partial [Luteolibacter sp.]|nr:UDP-N-acetyl-D-glucosamine dehydrogenase [Luteolibacter sp.]